MLTHAFLLSDERLPSGISYSVEGRLLPSTHPSIVLCNMYCGRWIFDSLDGCLWRVTKCDAIRGFGQFYDCVQPDGRPWLSAQ